MNKASHTHLLSAEESQASRLPTMLTSDCEQGWHTWQDCCPGSHMLSQMHRRCPAPFAQPAPGSGARPGRARFLPLVQLDWRIPQIPVCPTQPQEIKLPEAVPFPCALNTSKQPQTEGSPSALHPPSPSHRDAAVELPRAPLPAAQPSTPNPGFRHPLTVAEGLDQHVRPAAQPPQGRCARGPLEVERQGALAAALHVRGHGGARGPVHPHHAGPEVGEDHAAERRRRQTRQLQHPQPAQRHAAAAACRAPKHRSSNGRSGRWRPRRRAGCAAPLALWVGPSSVGRCSALGLAFSRAAGFPLAPLAFGNAEAGGCAFPSGSGSGRQRRIWKSTVWFVSTVTMTLLGHCVSLSDSHFLSCAVILGSWSSCWTGTDSFGCIPFFHFAWCSLV